MLFQDCEVRKSLLITKARSVMGHFLFILSFIKNMHKRILLSNAALNVRKQGIITKILAHICLMLRVNDGDLLIYQCFF